MSRNLNLLTMNLFLPATLALLLLLAPTTTSAQTLVALGDSLCAGTLPDKTTFVSNDSYTDGFYEYLSAENGYDSLQKLCCPGEDSNEFVNGSFADPPSDGSFCYGGMDQLESQLQGTLGLIQADPNAIGIVTISIGANDFIPCLVGDVDDPEACVQVRTQQFLANMNDIIQTLQNETNVPIIAMTPYNPFLAFYLSDAPEHEALAMGSEVLLETVVSALVENVYGPLGVEVVDAHLVFDGNNDTGNPPQKVVNICDYTGMCYLAENGTYVLENEWDIHTNVEGYQVLADAHIALYENGTITEPPTSTMGPAPTPTPTSMPTTSAARGSWYYHVSLVVVALVSVMEVLVPIL